MPGSVSWSDLIGISVGWALSLTFGAMIAVVISLMLATTAFTTMVLCLRLESGLKLIGDKSYMSEYVSSGTDDDCRPIYLWKQTFRRIGKYTDRPFWVYAICFPSTVLALAFLRTFLYLWHIW